MDPPNYFPYSAATMLKEYPETARTTTTLVARAYEVTDEKTWNSFGHSV